MKGNAIGLSNLKGNAQEFPRDLGIKASLIYRWRKELNNNPELAFGGNGKPHLTPYQKEINRLQKELNNAKMECHI